MKITPRYWVGRVNAVDDFGDHIIDTFVDGLTKSGVWAFMTPASHDKYGVGLGTGLGQRYQKQDDGKWLKVKG